MLIKTPKSLHYPITVTELLKQPEDDVQKFQPLFSYYYKSTVTEGNEFGEEFQVEKTFPTRFESETDGKVLSWKIEKGEVITGPGVALVEIEEPCRHDIQFGGMCASCGKDMTQASYATSRPDTTRASINMSHGNTALRVSQEEAARVEQEAKRRLLKSRKLSLVVDLDQTIIHATVDPTVAEWQSDEANPNHDAVKDVRKFQLVDDHPSRGCWYHIKLRPGLEKFLEEISKIYELHIYTMGTRAYALNIASIVDPERKIFGDRILSRDESGSLTAKNLHRLFPVDTKMVVIIDDRGDVWNWSDNLIKVKPYDFFVGIGDINSSFLPKREELLTQQEAPDSAAPVAVNGKTGDASQPTSASSDTSTSLAEDEDNATLKQLVSMGGASDPESMKQKAEKQDETITAQLEDRPLMQKQKLLDRADDEAAVEAAKNGEEDGGPDEPPGTPPKQRHNLLRDDDAELVYLERALRQVHSRFYTQYDKLTAGTRGGRIAELRGQKSPKKRPAEDLEVVPDVKEVMPTMKQQVFKDVVMVFSGVVPLGIYAKNSDIGRWAQSFGATINMDVHKNTTHVIANKNRRTAKVRVAARNPKIKIVTTAWLFDCVSQWKKVDETPYLIEVEPEQKEQMHPTSPVFDAVAGDLSSSEDENGVNDGSSQPSLTLDTDVLVENNQDESRLSPADQVTDDQWTAMMAEIDEGSDTEDGEDTDGDGSESDATRTSSKDNKKRKRENGVSANIADNEEEGASANGTAESKLQQRKRRALARTSSLTNVASTKHNGNTHASASTGLVDIVAKGADKESSSPQPTKPASEAGTEDGDDGFSASIQAELEAQLNAADSDDE